MVRQMGRHPPLQVFLALVLTIGESLVVPRRNDVGAGKLWPHDRDAT
jgi:hypothetical protein